MRENEKEKQGHALKLSELVVGEWYGCSSWESNIKAKYSIHSLFDADKFDYTERTNKDGSINTRPDWLRIYSYSRFSKTTIETGPADSTETPWYVYVPNKSSEYPQLEFWRRGTGLDKRGSWSIGQYIKHDRTVHKFRPDNCIARSYESFLEDVYLPYLKRFIRSDAQTYCYPFQLKEGDKFKLTSSISAKVEELRRIVSITHIGLIYYTTDSLLAKSMNNLVSLKLCNNTSLSEKAIDFLKNTPIENYHVFNPYSPGECFGPGIIPMITTPAEPKEIIYPKMPNKGLRKMQAKPLLNITKTI